MLLVFFLPSCLSMSKKYNDLVTANGKYDSKIDSVKKEYDLLKEQHDALALRVVSMSQDSIKQYESYKKLQTEYNRALVSGSSEIASNKRLLYENNMIFQERLLVLEEIQTHVKNREYLLNNIQARSEESVRQYSSKGVIVDKRMGSVVIFVPDSILFDSTSYTLSPQGVEFTKTLSHLISFQRNVNVVVGGHAASDLLIVDSEFGDEWDLSCWRATAITQEILAQKAISPKNIYAAGHGSWGIMADPSGIRSGKTEIIITPKIEDISELLLRSVK